MLGVSRETVRKWRAQFAAHRLKGLVDRPRSGAPRKITDEQVEAELVVNRRPCVMCYGAAMWSGIRHPASGIRHPAPAHRRRGPRTGTAHRFRRRAHAARWGRAVRPP
ncbi:helix-turn-helix domain-containing protein [Streptomyces sp. NPDC048483]|uniref:helix-turn-helix domain-containing protein n=1 Tax=Streptomyces sp. NPDC048483 TaxID=3154927 RepID=UPI003423F9C7